MRDHLLKVANDIAEKEVGLVVGPSAFAALACEPSLHEEALRLIVEDGIAYESARHR